MTIRATCPSAPASTPRPGPSWRRPTACPPISDTPIEGAAIDELAWLEQHVDVLFDTDHGRRLVRLNEPDPETGPPRLFLARARAATVVRFRTDVPQPLAADLEREVGAMTPWSGERDDGTVYRRLRELLASAQPIAGESRGPALRFGPPRGRSTDADVVLIDEANAHLLDRFFPYTRSVLGARSPVIGVRRDGVVVSACYAARKRHFACEAGVATQDEYRGHGFAVTAVSEWARAVEAAGMTPLYSTTWDNSASLRVAAKLGLITYAEAISVT